MGNKNTEGILLSAEDKTIQHSFYSLFYSQKIFSHFTQFLVGRAAFSTANEIISQTLISSVRLCHKEQIKCWIYKGHQVRIKKVILLANGITSTDIVCLGLLHLISKDPVKLKKQRNTRIRLEVTFCYQKPLTNQSLFHLFKEEVKNWLISK